MVFSLLVTAGVTLEHSGWFAGEMSVGLIYDSIGSVCEKPPSVCVAETGINRRRVLDDAEECDVMSLNGVVA